MDPQATCSRLKPNQVDTPPPRMSTGIYGDGTYLEKNPTWHEEHSPWKASQVLKMLQRNRISPSSLCEVGCGAGGILSELAARLPQTVAVGYEVSPQAYALCTGKAGAKLEFRLADILETEDRYDVVMAIDVFEHIEDYIGFLRKLKPHGRFQLFHIPLDINVQTVIRASPLRKVREEVGHLHYFTKETALRALETSGYRIRDWFYTFGLVEGPGRKRSLAKIAYIPRKIALAVNQDLAVRFLGGCSLMVLSE
jgi:SAM-dependent methyltransferase